MDFTCRFILYILIANVAFMIFSLARRGFSVYSGYLAQLAALISFMILLIARGYDNIWGILLSVGGIFVLVVVPLIIQRQIEQLIVDQQLTDIEPLARWKARLAWSDSNYHFHAIALILAQPAAAPGVREQALRGLLGKGEPYDDTTRVFLCLLHFQGRRFDLLIADLVVPGRAYLDYPAEGLLYLTRSFLETGRFEDAVLAQLALEEKSTQSQEPIDINVANLAINRLIFFAFLGWREDFLALLDDSETACQSLPPALVKYWDGISLFHAGDLQSGSQHIMQAMQEAQEELPEHWASWMRQRLQVCQATSSIFAEQIQPELLRLRGVYRASLLKLTAAQKTDADVNADTAKNSEPASAVRFLMVLNVGIYLLISMFGNIFDVTDLIKFGANSSFLVNQGQYFRLVFYQGLHLGLLHLFMNVLALNYLGPPVERVLGPWVLTGVYLLCGIGGGVLTVVNRSGLSLGASAAVIGLLGVWFIFELAGRSIPGPRQRRGSNLSTLAFFIVLNLIIGFVEQGIDNSAHVGGFLTGAILGIVLLPVTRRPRLRRVLSVLSMMMVMTVVGLAGWQYRSYAGVFYPQGPLSWARQTVPRSALTFAVPDGWQVTSHDISDSGEVGVVHLQGPIGESTDVKFFPLQESVTELVEEFIKQRSHAFTESSSLSFKGYKGPRRQSLDGREVTSLVWALQVGDRAICEADFFFRLEDRILFLECVLPTALDERYQQLCETMIKSIHIKEK